MNNDFKKDIFTKVLKGINAIALCLAMLSVESTCVWVHHQPKVPENLKKMARNNESFNK